MRHRYRVRAIFQTSDSETASCRLEERLRLFLRKKPDDALSLGFRGCKYGRGRNVEALIDATAEVADGVSRGEVYSLAVSRLDEMMSAHGELHPATPELRVFLGRITVRPA